MRRENGIRKEAVSVKAAYVLILLLSLLFATGCAGGTTGETGGGAGGGTDSGMSGAGGESVTSNSSTDSENPQEGGVSPEKFLEIKDRSDKLTSLFNGELFGRKGSSGSVYDLSHSYFDSFEKLAERAGLKGDAYRSRVYPQLSWSSEDAKRFNAAMEGRAKIHGNSFDRMLENQLSPFENPEQIAENGYVYENYGVIETDRYLSIICGAAYTLYDSDVPEYEIEAFVFDKKSGNLVSEEELFRLAGMDAEAFIAFKEHFWEVQLHQSSGFEHLFYRLEMRNNLALLYRDLRIPDAEEFDFFQFSEAMRDPFEPRMLVELRCPQMYVDGAGDVRMVMPMSGFGTNDKDGETGGNSGTGGNAETGGNTGSGGNAGDAGNAEAVQDKGLDFVSDYDLYCSQVLDVRLKDSVIKGEKATESELYRRVRDIYGIEEEPAVLIAFLGCADDITLKLFQRFSERLEIPVKETRLAVVKQDSEDVFMRSVYLVIPKYRNAPVGVDVAGYKDGSMGFSVYSVDTKRGDAVRFLVKTPNASVRFDAPDVYDRGMRYFEGADVYDFTDRLESAEEVPEIREEVEFFFEWVRTYG